MQKKIHIITMGCSKNLVDSEFLGRQFEENGFETIYDEDNSDAPIVLINTCGFINDAKEESIETILQFSEAKKDNLIEKLYVFGCLSQRYKSELEKEIDNVNGWYGVSDIPEILKDIQSEFKYEISYQRKISTPSYCAYLKISEGCDRTCAFCSIPLIRGKHISKSEEEVLKEAQFLTSKGVKEIMLIAQDLSYYGYDLYKENRLSNLLSQLSDIKDLDWIRMHYAFPAKFPMDIIPLIKEKEKICNYLDIPFQHISDNMLKIMRRGHDKKTVLSLIDELRTEIPDIALRTTMLVGHPGETEKDFEELLEFINEIKFERLGVFTYSHEEDTYAWLHYKDDIPEEVKNERAEILMDSQQQISKVLNSNKINKSFKVIIDRVEEGTYIGRTQYDSPEVDNEVIITTDVELSIGEFYNVKITNADDFDLYGSINK